MCESLCMYVVQVLLTVKGGGGRLTFLDQKKKGGTLFIGIGILPVER